jgi:hypothetical protein
MGLGHWSTAEQDCLPVSCNVTFLLSSHKLDYVMHILCARALVGRRVGVVRAI